MSERNVMAKIETELDNLRLWSEFNYVAISLDLHIQVVKGEINS